MSQTFRGRQRKLAQIFVSNFFHPDDMMLKKCYFQSFCFFYISQCLTVCHRVNCTESPLQSIHKHNAQAGRPASLKPQGTTGTTETDGQSPLTGNSIQLLTAAHAIMGDGFNLRIEKNPIWSQNGSIGSEFIITIFTQNIRKAHPLVRKHICCMFLKLCEEAKAKKKKKIRGPLRSVYWRKLQHSFLMQHFHLPLEFLFSSWDVLILHLDSSLFLALLYPVNFIAHILLICIAYHEIFVEKSQ